MVGDTKPHLFWLFESFFTNIFIKEYLLHQLKKKYYPKNHLNDSSDYHRYINPLKKWESNFSLFLSLSVPHPLANMAIITWATAFLKSWTNYNPNHCNRLCIQECPSSSRSSPAAHFTLD